MGTSSVSPVSPASSTANSASNAMLPAMAVSTAKMIRAQFLPAAVNAATNNKSTNRTPWFGSGLWNQVETDNATQTTAIAQMMNFAFR